MTAGFRGRRWFETYTVLTRLRGGLSRSPTDVVALLSHDFPASCRTSCVQVRAFRSSWPGPPRPLPAADWGRHRARFVRDQPPGPDSHDGSMSVARSFADEPCHLRVGQIWRPFRSDAKVATMAVLSVLVPAVR